MKKLIKKPKKNVKQEAWKAYKRSYDRYEIFYKLFADCKIFNLKGDQNVVTRSN
jgi:hypothetical protein